MKAGDLVKGNFMERDLVNVLPLWAFISLGVLSLSIIIATAFMAIGMVSFT